MKKKLFTFGHNLKTFLLIIVFLFISIRFNFLTPKPIISISKQDSAVNLNANLVDFFSLGYKRMIVAFFWISTILESDHEHYKLKNLNSWMYLRFKLISKLDPIFYENYAFGGPYLSVVKDDIPGASDIYNNGLKIFPEKFDFLRNAAFHFYFEEHDILKSKELYQKIIRYPNIPSYYFSIYAKIIGKEQSKTDAFHILHELYQKQDEDSVLKVHYGKKLYAIRAEIDLECLNKKMENCNTKDFFNNSYIFKNGKYMASQEWKSFFNK